MCRLTEPCKFTQLTAIAVVFAFFVAGCDQTVTEVPSEFGLNGQSISLFNLIPDQEYFLVGYIDLARFSGSRFGSGLINLSPPLVVWDKKLGISIDSFQGMVFASDFPEGIEDEPDPIILLKSDLTSADVLKMLGKKLKFFKKKEFANTDVYTLEDFSFAFPKEGIVALGSSDLVKGCLEYLSAAEQESLSYGDGLKPFEDFLTQTDTLWIGVNGIDKLVEPVAEKQPLLKIFTTLETGFIGIRFEENADFRFIAKCKSEEDAEIIANGIRGFMGILNHLVTFEDFSEAPEELEPERLREHVMGMLESVEIESSERQIRITFLIPGSLMEFLMEKAGEIWEYREAREAEEPEPLEIQ